MSKIAVLVDSSNNLTPAELTELSVFSVNAPILAGEHVYHENIDWPTQKAFFDFQRSSEEVLTTSQVEPGVWLTTFDAIAEQGYTDVIVVSLSSAISGTFSTLEGLAETVTNIKVYPWDSLIAAAGAGNQARLAATMANTGHSLDEIFAQLTILRESTKVLFVVDDVRHLQRTGRISNGAAFLGSLLNIKPMLTFDAEGKIVAIGKERQMKRAWASIQRSFATVMETNQTPIRISLIDSNNPKLADQWAAEITAQYQDQVIVERGPIGQFISVHTGEKALGFIWAIDWKTLI